MKAIMPSFNKEISRPLYLQLYDYIKAAILEGEIKRDERLPSLRALAADLKVSLTTVSLAYNQLAVEGYIEPMANSGYYIKDVGTFAQSLVLSSEESVILPDIPDEPVIYDLSCFDFNKWKKCSNKVFTEYPQYLLFEGDPQGELPLRHEISKYVYNSRGVTAKPEQIVIGAGTQQITAQLTRILNAMGIIHAAMEEPGYMPVRNIFRDHGFVITPVPVAPDGIMIEKLPDNIRSAVYVCPSNQFPTGAVMPIGKRRDLLQWAYKNSSIIIEDDYDSELRYFGRPVPAMQGMDRGKCVVYLGSFSSTLFPSIKISYMILPEPMAEIFQKIKGNYTQTCSKAEQLTLSLFMKNGMYQTNIKKLRNLYGQKLQKALSAISLYGSGRVRAINTTSGINIILEVADSLSVESLCERAAELNLSAVPADGKIIFYYNQIPLEEISPLIEEWFSRKDS